MYKIIEILEELNPKSNFAYTAIDKINDPKRIAEFYLEYILFIHEQDRWKNETSDEAKKVVDENIGYIVGYFGSKTAKLWFDTLPDIRHPVLGRDEEYFNRTPEECFRLGLEWGKRNKLKEEKENGE